VKFTQDSERQKLLKSVHFPQVNQNIKGGGRFLRHIVHVTLILHASITVRNIYCLLPSIFHEALFSPSSITILAYMHQWQLQSNSSFVSITGEACSFIRMSPKTPGHFLCRQLRQLRKVELSYIPVHIKQYKMAF